MDNQLQNLRRQLATGDTSVLPQIEALECRIEGHQYKHIGLNWGPSERWIRVEICQRCLHTTGIRPTDVPPSPDIFAYRNRGSKYHAVSGFNGCNAIALCNLIHYTAPSAGHLRDCRSEITCKKCLAIIEADGPRYHTKDRMRAGVLTPLAEVRAAVLTPLAEVLSWASGNYYHYLINLFSEEQVAEWREISALTPTPKNFLTTP